MHNEQKVLLLLSILSRKYHPAAVHNKVFEGKFKPVSHFSIKPVKPGLATFLCASKSVTYYIKLS